jgi:hypothetical protein
MPPRTSFARGQQGRIRRARRFDIASSATRPGWRIRGPNTNVDLRLLRWRATVLRGAVRVIRPRAELHPNGRRRSRWGASFAFVVTAHAVRSAVPSRSYFDPICAAAMIGGRG